MDNNSNTNQFLAQQEATALAIRLNTQSVLDRVRIFLTGKVQLITYDKNDQPQIVETKLTEPKCNSEGLHWFLNYVENIINPQVVQGNFKDWQYEKYIEEVHDGLIINAMNNLFNWGIKEDDYEAIIDNIMNLIIPFASRLVDDRERGSYKDIMKIHEVQQIQPLDMKKRNLLGLGGV